MSGPKAVAIVGGSGFIGHALVSQLYRQVALKIIDLVPREAPAGAVFVAADVCDRSALLAALGGCDTIIHLAAAHRDDIRPLSRYFEVNVRGTETLCDAAQELGIGRIIFVSTVAIYGLQSGAVDETSPPRPFNVYGKSKLQAEEVLRAWWTRDTRSRVLEIIRLPAVFGPGNRGNVYNLVSQVARGHFVMVGSGRNRKSMAYVGNVAAFLTHLVKEPRRSGSRLYNYCDKPDLSMNELLRIARRALRRRATPGLRLPIAIGLMIASCFDVLAWATRKNFAISRVRVQKFCAHTVFESQLMRETRFEPPFALEDALERTIAEEFTGRP